MRSKLQGDVQRRMTLAHKKLIAKTIELTGANTELMKKAGAVLQKHIRKGLSQTAPGLRQSIRPNAAGTRRMRGDPSEPGESPHKITGRLRRGIKNKVIEGVRQVRAENFRSKILEFGFTVGAEAPRRITKGKRKGQMTKGRAAKTVAPRPFMRPGMESAKPELAQVGAQILRDNIRKGGLGLGVSNG